MESRIALKSMLAATIVIGTLFFAPSAHAQEVQEVVVNVPFDFSVNRLHFEAGSYKFDLGSDTFGMSVVALKTGKKQFINARPQDSSLSPELGFLVFSQTGSNHYLSEVHFSGTAGYSKLNVPQGFNGRHTNTILQGALRK